MRERWSIREIGRVGAGSSLDEDERVWYDLNKRDDGIRPRPGLHVFTCLS